MAFGSFRLFPPERCLFRHDVPIELDPKAFDTLVLLVRHSGRLLSRQYLLKRLWPDTVVDENYLSVNISKVRVALGESARDWVHIETVRGHGYRFHGAVEVIGEAEDAWPEAFVARRTRTYLKIEEDLDERGYGVRKPGAAVWGVRAPVGVLLACILLVGVGLLFVWQRHAGRADGGARSARTMAVLPLAPLRPASAEAAPDSTAYLGLGLADALITKLSNLDVLVVRPTSAVARFAQPLGDTSATVDPVMAGEALHVESVLQGHVQQVGEQLRVTLQLVDVSSGQTRWSGSFQVAFTGIFSVQEAVARQVTRALALELDTSARDRLAARETEDPEAYRSYLKGRYFWNKRTGPALVQSRRYFEQALDLDPTYARAWAGLADAYALLGNYGAVPPAEAYPRARQAARQALALDSTLADAHTVLALALRDYYWDWQGAASHFRQAVRFGPNNATAHHQYAVEYLSVMGHHREAVETAEKAALLDPLSLIISADLGRVYNAARQPDRAIDQLKRTLAMGPDFFMARIYLGIAHLQKGQPEIAIPIFIQAGQASGDSLGPNPNAIAYHGVALARAGREAEARQVLDELYALRQKRYVPPYWLGFLHGNLGDMDEAFAWFDSAFADRNLHLVYLKDSPILSDFRSDPRASDLLERMGLDDGSSLL